MPARHKCRRGPAGSFELEGLEARIVLAAPHDLAVVGMTFDPTDGYVPYAAELAWAEDRSVTGEMFVTGASGPVGPTDANFTDFINGPTGAVLPFLETQTFADGVIGARFIADEGYPLGWIGGSEGAFDAATADVAAVIERSSDASVADLVGNWSFQITHISAEGVFTRHGQVSFSSVGGFFSLATGATGDPIWAGEGFEFSGEPDRGRFDIGMGSGDSVVMYMNADKSVLLIADMDARDGDSWMGIGLRQGIELSDADVVGAYRAGVLLEGQDAVGGGDISDLNDGEIAFSVWMDLADDGTFRFIDIDDAERGDFSDPSDTGTWTHSDGVVTLHLTEINTNVLLKLSDNGASGIVLEFQQQSTGLTERPMGVVTKVIPDSEDGLDTVLAAGIFDPDGVPLQFDLREGTDAWTVVDFERYALPDLTFWMEDGLGTSPADIEAFETSDDRLMAAITTDEGLFVVARDAAGFWRLRDLTNTIDSAANITSTITVFADLGGVSYVAGLTPAGEVVTYEFDPAADDGAGAWSFTNISTEHLLPQSEETPVFVGPIISYVTSWNGLNIAGLGADGSILAVWSGDGGKVWHASNLSVITGAPAMASGLTAYLTSWDGINIIGLDESGQVLATWWVPAFVGNWQVSNLTAISSGPSLTGASLTSFVAPWGALNISGIDAGGDVQAYWWTPETDQWQVANLTAAIGPGDPKPTEQLQSQTNSTHGGELNILGTDPDSGDLLRLFFRVDEGVWTVQNVSEVASYA